MKAKVRSVPMMTEVEEEILVRSSPLKVDTGDDTDHLQLRSETVIQLRQL